MANFEQRFHKSKKFTVIMWLQYKEVNGDVGLLLLCYHFYLTSVVQQLCSPQVSRSGVAASFEEAGALFLLSLAVGITLLNMNISCEVRFWKQLIITD